MIPQFQVKNNKNFKYCIKAYIIYVKFVDRLIIYGLQVQQQSFAWLTWPLTLTSPLLFFSLYFSLSFSFFSLRSFSFSFSLFSVRSFSFALSLPSFRWYVDHTIYWPLIVRFPGQDEEDNQSGFCPLGHSRL